MRKIRGYILFVLVLAIVTMLLCGFGTISVNASTQKIYNFSDLDDEGYIIKKTDKPIFGGDIIISSTSENADVLATASDFSVDSPDGGKITFSKALKAKNLSAKFNLSAGETVVIFYRGSDSNGTKAKAIDMKITDTATNTAVMAENNAEGQELKPYTIRYTSESGGTYCFEMVNPGDTTRVMMYGVVITDDSSYNPVPGVSVNPGDSTPNPQVTTKPGEPTPTAAPTAEPLETVDPNTRSDLQIFESNGWFESAYVKWTNDVAVDKYNVYVKGEGDADYTKIDDELVRFYGDYYRADALGLKAGKYTLKVAAVIGGKETDFKQTDIIDVIAYERTGYAFDSSSPYYNAEGVGGYKNDGTVKDGAKIVYIDDTNKDTVKFDVVTDTGKNTVTTCTGLVEILAAREKNNAETTPLIIRMIGQVESPAGKNSAGYVQIKATQNITFEGVGDDATTYHWSFLVRETNNVEIRNLAVMEFYDDGISLDTNDFNDWVHNCDIFYGQDRGGDQKKGDGSLDVKSGSDYVTFSYNHFWDSGKTSLCGMNQDEGSNFHVTYHHNWFDHSDSRHPRVRAGTIHVYNNYYDGNSKYGAGATTGSSVFVEANYFRNCKYPVLISQQGSDISGNPKGTFSGEDGGIIKMYGNKIVGGHQVVNAKDAPVEFDAYIADTRDEQVSEAYKAKLGGSVYNNFDTAPNMYSYVADDAEDVPEKVMKFAGRMFGGDFSYEFNDAVDDDNADRNTVLGTALQKYKTSLSKTYTKSGSYPSTGGSAVKPTPPPIINDDVYYEELPSINGKIITAKIVNRIDDGGVLFVAAAYDSNGMVIDAKTAVIKKAETAQEVSVEFESEYSNTKFYLWSKDTLIPYSDVK